jgi:O-antigen/teichoic acid export membrane protein
VTTARKVAWNTIAQALARTLALGLAIVVTALLTRHFGVAGYGSYITVTVYVSFFALFFDWGIATMLARELAAEGRSPSLVARALTLRLVLTLPVMAIAGGIGFALYHSDAERAIRYGILITLPTILFSAVSSTLSAVFQAELKLDRVAAAETISQVVLAAIVIVLVEMDESLYAIFAATVLGSALNAGILVWFAKKLTPLRVAVDVPKWRELLRRSLPLGLALMVATIYFRADAILLSLLKGPKDVGIYGVAYRMLEALTAFPGFFYASIFPLISAFARRADLDSLRSMAQRSFDLLVLAAIPVVLGTIALAPEIVRALAGDEFSKSVTPLRLVIIGAGLMFINGLLAYMLIALDRQVSVLWLATAALVFNLALNLVLIPAYSYTAAAAVATASEVFSLAGSLWLTRKYADFVPGLSVAAKGAVAGVVMFFAIFLIDTGLVASIGIGIVVYLGVLLLLQTHRSLELRELLGPGSV